MAFVFVFFVAFFLFVEFGIMVNSNIAVGIVQILKASAPAIAIFVNHLIGLIWNAHWLHIYFAIM